jgi:hypothetical protein
MSDKEKDKVIEIPEGFEMVSDGTLTETHDFKKIAIVMGKVLTMKTVPLKRGNVIEDNRMITVDTGEGTTAVWESASLKDLFDDMVVGDNVYIRYDGDEDMGGGRQPMKKFVTGLQRLGLRSVPDQA